MREQWVVISNCHSFGLANSIQCLARDIDCVAIDYWDFMRRAGEDPDLLREYDFALILNEAFEWAEGSGVKLPPHMRMPAFEFWAYQPDCIYILADGAELQGPMRAYHSMIALAAYKEGLSAEQAARFFNAGIFALAGYLNSWVAARDGQIEVFRNQGLDIGRIFLRHGRGTPFMHTGNHPKIEILFDIARVILERLDRRIFADVDPPPDNLAGTTWPVYPEIGEQLGVRGSYLFKLPDAHKPLELIPFLSQSLAAFGAWDRSLLRVFPSLQKGLQRVRHAMREAV